MTNRLDELQGLLDSATPGEWKLVSGDDGDGTPRWYSVAASSDHAHVMDATYNGDHAYEDAALIVFLRNHAEDLLAVAQRCVVHVDVGGPIYQQLDQCLICTCVWPVDEPNHPKTCPVARLSPPSEEGS